MTYTIRIEQISDDYSGWGWFTFPNSSNFRAEVHDSWNNWIGCVYGATERITHAKALRIVEDEKRRREIRSNITTYEVPE